MRCVQHEAKYAEAQPLTAIGRWMHGNLIEFEVYLLGGKDGYAMERNRCRDGPDYGNVLVRHLVNLTTTPTQSLPIRFWIPSASLLG